MPRSTTEHDGWASPAPPTAPPPAPARPVRSSPWVVAAVLALVLVVGLVSLVVGGSQDSDETDARPDLVVAERVATPPVLTPSVVTPSSETPSFETPVATAPVGTPVATPPVVAPGPAAGSALALLAQLEVKGRAPRTGYDRELFGQTWADTDRNGCDTRNDILRRDLTGVILREGSSGCVVLTGTLLDPFSARTIPFQRGETTSTAVQIDHVVALSDVWQKGAQQWTPQRRVAFANDPLNLLAVDGPLNSQKSDGDAATWLPPAKGFRCAYVARQVAVKAKFGAWVTAAEHGAIAGILQSCPDEPVPAGAAATESSVGAATAISLSAAAPSAPAGAAPIPRGAGAADPACDPSYPEVCIPPLFLVGDLNCGDVAEQDIVVLAPDPHGFDRDGNGLGCVS